MRKDNIASDNEFWRYATPDKEWCVWNTPPTSRELANATPYHNCVSTDEDVTQWRSVDIETRKCPHCDTECPEEIMMMHLLRGSRL